MALPVLTAAAGMIACTSSQRIIASRPRIARLTRLASRKVLVSRPLGRCWHQRERWTESQRPNARASTTPKTPVPVVAGFNGPRCCCSCPGTSKASQITTAATSQMRSARKASSRGVRGSLAEVTSYYLAKSGSAFVFALLIISFAFGKGLLSKFLSSRPFVVLG